MYTINDLRSIDTLELMRIAKEIGADYKKTDSQESIIYAILDKQAELSSVSDVKKKKRKESSTAKRTKAESATKLTEEKASAEENSKRTTTRTRTTKRTTQDEALVVEQLEEQAVEEAIPSTPKRRGRKPKVEKKETETTENLSEESIATDDKELTTSRRAKNKQTEKAESDILPEDENKDDATVVTASSEQTYDSSSYVEMPLFASQHTEEHATETPDEQPSPTTSEAETAVTTEIAPWEGDPEDGTDFIVVDGEVQQEDGNVVRPTHQVPPPYATHAHTQPAVVANYTFPPLRATGVLEVSNDGSGILRSSDYNYLPSPDDIFISVQQVKRYALKTGDVVCCNVYPPQEGGKYYEIQSIELVNGRNPDFLRDRIQFENLTPLFPEEKFTLCGDPSTTNLSTRIVDLFSPIGKGQRALIVAQPKTGKTMLMKDVANAIAANHPEAYLMMLLIDERPEEVTDMARTVNAEVIASTFDEPAERHVKIATIVLEKAKRMVECGHDVVIFLDSITRLARAYNTVSPTSGRILSGGVEATALQKPKRFFGAARKIEGGGSLTIIATALIDTGSKMDEVIFEEFKGTGNMELVLDRTLSNKRIFPAVNLVTSSTRRDDLLQDQTTLDRMWILRKHIAEMSAMEAMKTIYDRMHQTESNEEFLATMNS